MLDAIEGVALIYWLLGNAEGTTEQLAALHGPRLERLLEEIVDTPVRGFVYEIAPDLKLAHAESAFDDPASGRRTLADPVRGRRRRSGQPRAVARGDARRGPRAGRLTVTAAEAGLRWLPVHGAWSATFDGGWSRSSANSLIPIPAPINTTTTIAYVTAWRAGLAL